MQAISFKFWLFFTFLTCSAFQCFEYETIFEEIRITSDFKEYKNGYHLISIVVFDEFEENVSTIQKKIENANEIIFLRHYSTGRAQCVLSQRDCLGTNIFSIRNDQVASIIISSKPLMDLVKIEVKDNGTNEKVIVSDTKEPCFELPSDSPFTTSFTMRDTSFFIPVFPDSINPVFIRVGDKLIYEKELEVKRDIVTIKI